MKEAGVAHLGAQLGYETNEDAIGVAADVTETQVSCEAVHG